jgi:hypothetical protein
MRARTILAAAALAAAVTVSGTATAFAGSSGFKTGPPSMLTPVKAGVEVTPLLTVGDVLSSGYRLSRSRTGAPCALEAGEGRTSS